MALDKAIEYGKEHRKPYKGAKVVDCSCRNHGTCEWCRNNRIYRSLREMMRTIDEMNEDEYI